MSRFWFGGVDTMFTNMPMLISHLSVAMGMLYWRKSTNFLPEVPDIGVINTITTNDFVITVMSLYWRKSTNLLSEFPNIAVINTITTNEFAIADRGPVIMGRLYCRKSAGESEYNNC